MSNYNAESIQHLSFREGVRTRVSMYLGSPDNEGVLNGFFEVINNATDEALGGFGKEIYIGISPAQKKFTVIDKGRGIPRGPTEISAEILITIMTTSHSGAKFNKESYQGYSRGLNGIGVGATCMSSDYMKIVTKRDGHTWELEFDKGLPMTEKAYPINKTKETGSLFTWVPSQEVFAAEEIVIDFNKIRTMIEEYSFFNAGVAFTLENEDTKEKYTYLSRNGIRDFADKVIKKPLHQKYLIGEVKENGVEIEALAKWTNGTGRFHLFVNGAECPDGGQPITGARTAITRTVNNLSRGQFTGELIRKGFVYVISIKHPEPMFSNQTKTSIGNPELRKMCDQLFSNMVRKFQSNSEEEFNKLIETFGKIEKAEAAAERARITIMQSTKEIERMVNRKVFASDKLKDSIKTGQESILLLAEGKSAVGALSQARDPQRTGLLEIRGKIINAMTNPEDKVLQNEEVQLIFSALGQVPGKYSARKLRYGSVGIATDSDK